MTAFGYEPDVVPAAYQYERPATLQQQRFLQAVRDNSQFTQREFGRMNRAILEAYGYVEFKLNEGTAFVLCDFWKNSRAKHRRALERSVRE